VESGSPHETFFSQRAAQFTQATGIQVEFLGVPHANMHQQFLSDALSGAGAYDVLATDQPWVPEFAAKGFLLPLDDRLAPGDRDDFVPGTLDTVSYNGALYGLPFMVHNLVLYYRTDLFEAAGISAPPTTWDEYREYARRLTDPAAGVWGTLVPGKQDGEVATRIHSFLQQAGGDVVDATGAASFDSEPAREAFALMTGIQFDDRSSPDGLHDLTTMQGLFLQGKVAMAPVWPYLYSLGQDPAQSQVAGRFAVALHPGEHQGATTYSWGFGISAASRNADAAWRFVQWATNTEQLTGYGKDQVNPVPRASAVEALTTDGEIDDAGRRAIATFSESVERSKTIPMVPAYSQLQNDMAVAASAVMARSKTVDRALADAQASMTQALRSS
jgi:ABC-type glycerol-3-phosphate transport system substrate-binding protein